MPGGFTPGLLKGSKQLDELGLSAYTTLSPSPVFGSNAFANPNGAVPYQPMISCTEMN